MLGYQKRGIKVANHLIFKMRKIIMDFLGGSNEITRVLQVEEGRRRVGESGVI